jgi:hypothetical protein
MFDLPRDLNPQESLKTAMILLARQHMGEDWPARWEFTLWGFVEQGLRSWQFAKPAGIDRDDTIGIRRLSEKAGGWFYNGTFVPIVQWIAVYAETE